MTTALSVLRTRVIASHHLISENPNIFTQTLGGTIDGAINDAHNEICDAVFGRNRQFLRSSASLNYVSGTQTVAVPADFRTLLKAYRVSGTTRTRLVILPRFDDVDVVNTDNPSSCYCDGQLLWLAPIPNASVTGGLLIYYGAGHVDMDADADNMLLPDDFSSLVVDLAKIKLFVQEDWPMEGLWNLYLRKLEDKLERVSYPVTENVHYMEGV